MTAFLVFLAIVFNFAGAFALYLAAPRQRLLRSSLPAHATSIAGGASLALAFALYRQVAGPAASVFVLMTATMFLWTLPPLVIALIDANRKSEP